MTNTKPGRFDRLLTKALESHWFVVLIMAGSLGVVLGLDYISANIFDSDFNVFRIRSLQVIILTAGGCIIFASMLWNMEPNSSDSIAAIPFRQLQFSWAALLCLLLVFNMITFLLAWQTTGGAEYLWIAESLAGGHGFSLPATHRWMFIDFESSYPAGEYFPTALEEPVYPTVLAVNLRFLGGYGKFVMLGIHVICLFLTWLIVYDLGRTIFPREEGVFVGMLSGSILALWPAAHRLTNDLSPAVPAGLLVVVAAYLIVRCIGNVSVTRSFFLGLFLGFCSLTLAATIVFVPVAVTLVLLLARPWRPVVLKAALVIGLGACLVVVPWTVRNLVVFGELVPIRTGFGLGVHQANPILAATFSSGSHACSDTLGPLWPARNVVEAMQAVQTDRDKRFAVYKRSFDCIQAEAPDGYDKFNEAQRDKVYLERAIDFVISHPSVFFDMTIKKGLLFFLGKTWAESFLACFALIGAVMSWRNPRARILTVLIGVFPLAYMLGPMWFYRYRYPVEPLVAVLASVAIVKLAGWFWRHGAIGQRHGSGFRQG
jgi:hypothetical protein